MNCKNCGAPLIPGDQFCKNCGAPVSNNSVQNQNIGVNPNQSQMSNMTQPSNMAPNMVQPTNTMPNMGQSSNSIPNMGQQPNVVPNMGQSSNSMSNMRPTSNPVPQKSNNNFIFIIIGAVLVVIIIILAILLITKDGTSNQVVNTNNNNNSSGEVTPVSQTSTYKVTAIGHSFDVPVDVVYEKDTSQVIFGKESAGWVAEVIASPENYETYKLNKEQIVQNLESSGFTIIGNAEEKTVGNKKYIVIDTVFGTDNCTFAITELSSGYVAVIAIVDVIENKQGSLYLEDVNNIIKTAKYIGNTSNMETNNMPESWTNAFDGLE